MKSQEIPAFIEKSSIIVMNRERAEIIIDKLEIGYGTDKIKITEIMPVSYCTENEEYPYGGNPGKIEPAIKITNSISNARSLVTGSWQGNDTWINDVVGVSIIGFDAISRARTEVTEMMKRRKLKYVFVSYNISSEEGETLLDEIEDASVFACTAGYLLNSSFPIVKENPYTLELDKQINSVINHKTIPLPVKTFDCDWNMYKKVQISLAHLRHSEYKEVEDFVPLAHSVMNLMITSVFPFQVMENLIESGVLEIESPLQRIIRLTDMISAFSGEFKDAAKSILGFLEDGYTKLLTYSPKEKVLFDLLLKYRNQKVAIIVPKAYYANILYSQNILDYFDDATQLSISTANKFDYSQQYDVIVAIGAFWGKRFDPFKSRASSTIYVIVSAVEENLFKYRKRLATAIENKFNICAKVPIEYINDDAEVYTNNATEEEVSEVINSAFDVTEYINRIFETKSLDLLNSSSGTHYTTTEISHIATCSDGESIFFTKKYKAYVFDSAKEDVVEVPVERLSPGDMVIFKSNNNETRDIVTTLLDKYIDEYQTTSDDIKMAYLKSRYWKEVLRKYRIDNNLSFKELSERLESHGVKKHEATIQIWLAEDSYIVGPQDIETYVAIAEMTRDADMLANPQSYFDACEKIRSMLLVGQPKLTSEYIQASSRVGRSFPGVAFTMYDASKSRDRSHFEQFKQYHESFYRYVEPTGATPFSKPARDRSLKALLVAMIRNAEPALSSEKDASKFTVAQYTDVINELKSYIVARSISITKRLNPDMLNDGADIADEIDAFFQDWEERASVYDAEHFSYGEKYMVKHPDAEDGRLLKAFGTDDHNGFDAMTSMRNVDTTVAGNVIVWED